MRQILFLTNKKILIVLITLSVFSKCFAGEIHSIKNGDWSSSSTWSSGKVPTKNDDVIIDAGFKVTGTADTAKCRSLIINGDLVSIKIVIGKNGGGNSQCLINKKVEGGFFIINGYLKISNAATISGSGQYITDGNGNKLPTPIFVIDGNSGIDATSVDASIPLLDLDNISYQKFITQTSFYIIDPPRFNNGVAIKNIPNLLGDLNTSKAIYFFFGHGDKTQSTHNPLGFVIKGGVNSKIPTQLDVNNYPFDPLNFLYPLNHNSNGSKEMQITFQDSLVCAGINAGYANVVSANGSYVELSPTWMGGWGLFSSDYANFNIGKLNLTDNYHYATEQGILSFTTFGANDTTTIDSTILDIKFSNSLWEYGKYNITNLIINSGTLELNNAAQIIISGKILNNCGSSCYATFDDNQSFIQKNNLVKTPVTFPVGVKKSYLPLTIKNLGTKDNFQIYTKNTVPNSNSINPHLTKDWNIHEKVSGGSNATLTFQWNRSDEPSGFDRSNAKVAQYNGSTWNLYPVTVHQGSDTNTFVATVSGISSFSDFTITSADGSSKSLISLINEDEANLKTWNVNLYPNPVKENLLITVNSKITTPLTVEIINLWVNHYF
ncbi:MAG: hypothetical protein JO072_07320 [Parafilimonas sp.]|nr:hypothetical protein [Parafilimonas sp.]